MIRKISNQEKGIAMIIAPMVMIVLFLLAMAFFVSTQTEMSKSMTDKIGVISLNVSNAGAERTIWRIQQQLDNDPNWLPQDGESLFGTDYDSLIREKDPTVYKSYGVSLISGGEGSYLYGIKMVHEDDLTTPDFDEWAIYAAGVMRTPSPSGLMSSLKKVEQVRVLVRLGVQQLGFPPDSIHANRLLTPTNSLAYLYPDANGNSTVYSEQSAEDTVDTPLLQHQYTPWARKDGYRGDFDYRTSGPTIPPALQNADNTNDNITTQTNVPSQPTPDANLDYFRTIADYTASGGVIRDRNGIIISGRHITTRTDGNNHRLYNIGVHPTAMVVFKGTNPTQPPNQPNVPVFYDVNGDGQTVFYLEDGSLRTDGSIRITPNTRGIIVTRGRWVNTVDMEVDFNNPPPVMGYTDENNQRNENIGIAIYGGILSLDDSGNSWPYLNKTSVYRPYTDLTLEGKTVDYLEPLIGFNRGDLGTLDLFSEYDILMAPTPLEVSGGGPFRENGMIWRGFIYSKGSIMKYKDFILKGAIMAKEEFRIGNQGRLGRTMLDYLFPPAGSHSGGTYYDDGSDLILGYENINGNRNYFNNVFAGGQGGRGTGRMQILAWERYK